MLADKFVGPGGSIKVQGPWLKELSVSVLNLWIVESSCKSLHRCLYCLSITGKLTLFALEKKFLLSLKTGKPRALCFLQAEAQREVAQWWSVYGHSQGVDR